MPPAERKIFDVAECLAQLLQCTQQGRCRRRSIQRRPWCCLLLIPGLLLPASQVSSWLPQVNLFPVVGNNTKTPGGHKTPRHLSVQTLELPGSPISETKGPISHSSVLNTSPRGFAWVVDTIIFLLRQNKKKGTPVLSYIPAFNLGFPCLFPRSK